MEIVESIAEALAPDGTLLRGATGHDVALSRGSGGWAVFFAYAAAAGLGEQHRSTALTLLHGAMDAIASTPTSPRLYSGFPGVAWAASHLADRIDASLTPDAFDEIDHALGVLLGSSPWQREFDLLGGLVGLGVYALERLPRETATIALSRVIDRLEELAQRTPEGIAWRTNPALLPESARVLRPDGDFDLGMAHGVPGVIAFLGMAHAAGVARSRVRSLAISPQGRCKPWCSKYSPSLRMSRSRKAWACWFFLGSTACGRSITTISPSQTRML
jgi:hypothetical protein